ncbi:MAG TPA: hypothetical protein VN442_10245 [Bryobacteraceae bacterium]|nr:hypothetical protein [Bryobacteraceae bacterium]
MSLKILDWGRVARFTAWIGLLARGTMSFRAAFFRLLVGEKQAHAVPASEQKHDDGDQHRDHSPAAHIVTVQTCHPLCQLRAASEKMRTRSNSPDQRRFIPGYATSGSKRDAQPACSKCRFVHSPARAAGGKLAVNNDSRYASDSVAFRLCRHVRLPHVQDRDLAAWAGDIIHQLDRFFTCGAARTENFNLSFVLHRSAP